MRHTCKKSELTGGRDRSFWWGTLLARQRCMWEWLPLQGCEWPTGAFLRVCWPARHQSQSQRGCPSLGMCWSLQARRSSLWMTLTVWRCTWTLLCRTGVLAVSVCLSWYFSLSACLLQTVVDEDTRWLLGYLALLFPCDLSLVLVCSGRTFFLMLLWFAVTFYHELLHWEKVQVVLASLPLLNSHDILTCSCLLVFLFLALVLQMGHRW